MKTILFDVCFVAGASAIVYAAWLTAPALAWLVGGLFLVAFGIFGSQYAERAKKQNKEQGN